MVEKIVLPQGYKKTPVGIIPKDWDVKRLGEFSQVFSGGTPKTSNPHYYKGDIPFIKSGEIKKNFTEQMLSEEGVRNSSAKIVDVGDLLYALYGANSGDCSLSKIKGAINQAILCIRTKADNYFLCSVLALNKGYYYNRFLQGGQGNLSAEIVKSYKIALPPLSEQKMIAEILGLWDKAIEKQSQLISQLELRKKGLMQQLLTGKKRLSGYKEKWGTITMNEHFFHLTETSKDCRYTPMTISAKLGFVSQQEKYDRIIAGDSLTRYTILHKGDFAYNKGNSHLYEMGCIYRLKESTAAVPFVYICFRGDDKVCGDFYHYFFSNHGLDRQLKKIITSGARRDGLLNVNKSDFFQLKLPYPQINEQNAIAHILIAQDKALTFEQQKLEHLRNQKRGLMQKLLTGKIRIK